MLVSVILIILAYINNNNAKKSTNKNKKDKARALLIAAWIIFAVEFIVAIFIYTSRSNKILVLAFPIFSIFFNKKDTLNSSSFSVRERMNHTYRGQANIDTGGRAIDPP